MVRTIWSTVIAAGLANVAAAQPGYAPGSIPAGGYGQMPVVEYGAMPNGAMLNGAMPGGVMPGAVMPNGAMPMGGYGMAGNEFAGEAYAGPNSVGNNEPLFEYDDQDPWKHGYLHEMPYYGGYHFGRPYNYHHVFSQVQTSVGWGLPHGLPYSQQWWHRYEAMADPGRVMSEPNGYYGQAQPAATGTEWASIPQPPRAPVTGPSLTPPVPGQQIAPVQYLPTPPARLSPAAARELRVQMGAPQPY